MDKSSASRPAVVPFLSFKQENLMHVKRVLVWDTEFLLGKGVELSLASETGLDVVGIESRDEFELFKAIERHQPYAVVLCDSDHLLKEKDVIGTLLTGFPDIRVIMVSSDDKWMKVFYKREFLIAQASDLANIIGSNLTPGYLGDEE